MERLDWFFILLCVGLVLLPALPFEVSGEAVHTGAEQLWLWPTMRPVTLNPEITLGNVLSVLGVLWWVGRWGTKQLELLTELPIILKRMNHRLSRLEQAGCSRFVEHARLLQGLAEKKVVVEAPSMEIPDEDLRGEGCLR